ncbi:Protein fem-1-like protein A [Bienertia sinuspersici]
MENIMASLLLIAAQDGNIEFLIESLTTQSIDYFYTLSRTDEGISPILQVVRQGCEKVAVKILTSGHSYSISGDDDLSPLHSVPNSQLINWHNVFTSAEEVCKVLLDKHQEMIKKVDENGITLVHKWVMIAAYKCTEGIVEIVHVLLKTYLDSYGKEKGVVLQEPDAKGNTHLDVASELENDSPLHHIHLRSYSQYQVFFAIPLIQQMIDMPDINNSIPLYRALERRDMLFAEVLLSTNNVSRSIKDKSSRSATNLLAEL